MSIQCGSTRVQDSDFPRTQDLTLTGNFDVRMSLSLALFNMIATSFFGAVQIGLDCNIHGRPNQS